MRVVAAVDLGASGGRVIAGLVDEGVIRLEEVRRFDNGVVEIDGHLRWDLTRLWIEIRLGLTEILARFPDLESIAIDSWAVDYGLLDAEHRMLGEPISYRDGRTEAAVTSVHSRMDERTLYAIDGVQFLPFNTIYQLEAERQRSDFDSVAHIVLIPDLISFWLTGELATEATNASTTGLVDVSTGDWSDELLSLIGIERELLPPIHPAGIRRGGLLPSVADEIGATAPVSVIAVGSHDTASAVVAVPAQSREFAFISSGTWSLVGLELDSPIVSDAAFDANFTNESGVDGTVRFLRNVGGLWLLQESMREWSLRGVEIGIEELIEEARAITDVPTIDVDDGSFIAPGAMNDRIARIAGDPSLADQPARLARCVFESLALAYAETLRTASDLSGRSIEVVHIVGGGSQNDLLCQLTADRCGVPVVAGPTEATALGNVLIQARAIGAAPLALSDLRAIAARSSITRSYAPTSTGR